MELINGIKFAHVDITTGMDKTGQDYLVVVVKASYKIPDNNKVSRPIVPPPVPLVESDIYVAEPGLSAPLYENDYVLRKHKCDVLFNAHAYSPTAEPVKTIKAGYAIGQHAKAVEITGHRVWKKDLWVSTSDTVAFNKMPLHYGHAFGGTKVSGKAGSEQYDSYLENPIGTGYSNSTSYDNIHQYRLPNLNYPGRPIAKPDGNYEVHALSVKPKNALSRRKYAGTYDENWQKNVFPFLPEDFDEKFWQSAAQDQQIDYPQGGETVTLMNMMPHREMVTFVLPRLNHLPVKILKNNYELEEPKLNVDTLYFEPDKGFYSVVWRAQVKIKKRVQEVKTVVVGSVCKNWWAAKLAGQEGCSGCAKKVSTDNAPVDCEEA